MAQRIGKKQRRTAETDISVVVNLDGKGTYEVATGVGFLDHMLSHVAKHGLFDLELRATGDLHVDAHHTVEDVGICLGQAMEQALGDKAGINRYGFAAVPMDESLAEVAVDLSGRPALVLNAEFPTERVGQFDTELVGEFLRAFTNNLRCNLHVNVRYGDNSHHIAEAIFKALGRALSQAVEANPRSHGVPSTKEVL
jgi:imidazoleglycerol-phosphate dehydratase